MLDKAKLIFWKSIYFIIVITVFLLSLQIAKGQTYIDQFHGETIASTAAGYSQYYGIEISINQTKFNELGITNFNITKILKVGSDTSTKCAVFYNDTAWNSGNQLGSGVFVGNDCALNVNIKVNATRYVLATGTFNATTFTGIRNTAPSFPYLNEYITWTRNANYGGTPWNYYTSEIQTILNVTIALPAVAPAGDTPALTLYTDLVSGINTTANPLVIYFNGTSVNNSDYYVCTLKQNDTIVTKQNQWCYQETANISTNCGGNATLGNYVKIGDFLNSDPITKAIDGDWDTYVRGASGIGGTVYVNYTKPTYANNNSIWIVKDFNNSAEHIFYFNIPTLCWNQQLLQLSMQTTSPYGKTFRCYNGTGFQIVYYESDYSLLYEDAMNWSMNSLITDNISINQNFTIDTTNYEAGYDFNLTCTNENATASFLKTNIFIDTVAPSFTLLSFASNTVFYRFYDTLINITAKASDPNLFAVNVTIWKLSSAGVRTQKVLNYFNQSIPYKDRAAFYFTYFADIMNNATFNNSRYEIALQDWDSHTDNVVRNMTLYYSTNLMRAKDITFTSPDLIVYNKKQVLVSYFYLSADRYKMKLTFNDNALSHNFRLQTTGDLTYLQDTGYKGHFAYFGTQRWIDMQGKNVNYVTAVQYAPNDWNITVHLINASDEIELESIGDMNSYSVSYYFNITDGYGFTNTYSNFVNNTGKNYTNTLSMNYTYFCLDNSTISFKVNDAANQSLVVVCDNNINAGSLTFRYPTETDYNTSFVFISNRTINVTNLSTYRSQWYSDLSPPSVLNKSFKINTGFVTPNATLSFKCVDTMQPVLNYSSTLNTQIILYNKILANNTQQSNSSTLLLNGDNIYNATCSDGLNSTTNTTTHSIEIRTLIIIDEQLNTPFDVENLTSVKVFMDDNRSSYDFKAGNTANISFFSTEDVKLRFELKYSSGTIILRYVDIGLLQDDVRVCANTEGITHYEQILTSSTIRPVILKSVFADCVVAADYTRFAYQDAKILKAYTYNNLYYLYTFTNDDITQPQIFLAAVDGSIASYINLDTLEFLSQSVDLDLIADTITISKVTNATMAILYNNTQADNTALRVAILRMDTNAVLFNSSIVNPNAALILLDISGLTSVNETTIFKVIATATKSTGIEETVAFFSIGGKVGGNNAAVIFVITLLMLIFGLSFTASQYTFGWFGLLICIINIGLLSTALTAWYITFMLAVNAIIAVFIFLVMTGKNQATVG